jgi:plastocyanin
MRFRTVQRAAVLLLMLPLMVAVAACSSDDNKNDEAGTAAMATPVTSFSIVATDNKFDKKEITIPANQEITVTYENKGSAIHNFHVLGVKDTNGKDIMTQLNDKTATLKFTIATPGSYDFHCDVHPEMRGKLIVQ